MSRMATGLSLFFTLLLSVPALAGVIDITGVSNASNFTLNEDGTAKIFGGLAGTCTGTSNSTCNSCTVPEEACNPRRVHDTLLLRINFTVNEDLNAPLWFGYELGGTFTKWIQNSDFTANVSGNLTKGTSGFVEIQWQRVCLAGLGFNCLPDLFNNSMKLIIGASSAAEPAGTARNDIQVSLAHPDFDPTALEAYNNIECAHAAPSSGVCTFIAFPGDEKVYIRDIVPVGSYPTSNGVAIKFLRIFISTIGFTDANYTSPNYVDLALAPDGTGVPSPGTVTGLTNDVPHFFRPAVVDEAFNVAFLADDTEILATGGCGVSDDATCDLIAIPSRVLGLLTEDFNCFISTAAFGSSMAPEVQTFREFRNRYLLTSSWGVALTQSYYKYGPYLSRWIHRSEFLKAMARGSLYPALWYSKLSLSMGGPGKAAFVFLLGFGLLGGLIRWGYLWHCKKF